MSTLLMSTLVVVALAEGVADALALDSQPSVRHDELRTGVDDLGATDRWLGRLEAAR